jgi:hypothetical protein
MLISKKCLFIPVFVVPSVIKAQEFGGNPPSIKWNQINSSVSRIIFPQGMDSQASRIANVISYLNNTTQETIGDKQRKINLVLQNQTTVSNAYVALGPFRSEFFLTPLQNSFELGSLPWADQLAIHEFRHVQQYNNFNTGLSKVLRTLFGEEGQAFANNAAIPNWFFEGDAVFNETNVSKQGRGRLPFFFNAYRSLWLANRNFSWMKLRNGSYKDFIPDHYALGYLLVAYGREKYGDDFWKNVTTDAAAFKELFYPFQQAIKKYSGKNFVEFRNDALQHFRNDLVPETVRNVSNNVQNENYIDREYPSYIDSSTLIFVKRSYKLSPAFFIRIGTNERKIRTRDASLDYHFSQRNSKIVYASYRPDIRWGYRDYSELQLLDVVTGKQKTLTTHSKYFSPDISEDGKKIIAVKVEPGGRSSLEVLNAQTGDIISSIPNPENLFYTYPKFYGADKIISAVRNPDGQMSLAQTNINTGSTDYLVPFSYNVIGFPAIWNDTIYFSASHNTEDKLFAYAAKTKELYTLQSKIANEGLGYYQPAVTGNRIAWTTFTANGFHVTETDKASLQWINIEEKIFTAEPSSFRVTAINKTNTDPLAKVPQKQFKATRYSKATGIINFHSIEPYINDPEYSVTLVSQNILNTLQSQLSFTYNRNEKFKKISFDAIYGVLFPYLSAGIDYTIDRRSRYHGQRVYWNETEPGAGVSVPLNLSKGRLFTSLNFGTRYVFNQSDYQGRFKDTFGKVSYSYISNFFTFTNQVQKARQQIFPSFAQALTVSFKKAITRYSGSQLVTSGNIYLPGVLSTHSIVLNGAYSFKNKSGELNFSNGFPFSRGYTSENLYRMIKWGVNYHLPLLYPEKGMANIVYLLRLRTDLFYDQTHVKDFFSNGDNFKTDFRSVGTEIYFDTKWWNELPLTFGIRYSHLLDDDIFGGTGNNRWEFILPVNLLNN